MMHLTSVLFPAPFSPSSACTDPRASFSDTFSSAAHRPELLGDPQRLQRRRRRVDDRARAVADLQAHDSASSSAREVDTVPNTPFCIFTILIAAAWLPASVAAQQSSRMQALVAAIVPLAHGRVDADVGGDAGQDQVGDPALPQDQIEVGRAEGPLARLVDDRLAGQRRQLRDDLPAGLAADQDAAAGAGVADADALVPLGPARAPALVGGQIGQVGAVPLARVHDVVAAGAHLGRGPRGSA